MSLFFVLGGFLLAMIASEFVLGSTKLQTGIGRIIAVYSLVGTAIVASLLLRHGGGVVTLAIYWAAKL